MSCRSRRAACAALLSTLGMLASCTREPASAVAITPLVFDAQGISLALAPALEVRRVEVSDGLGALQVTLPWPAGPVASVAVPFRWRPGQSYTVRLRDASGRMWSRTGRADPAPAAGFELSFQVPHGAPPTAVASAFAAGTGVEGTIRLVSRSAQPLEVELILAHGGLLDARQPLAWETDSSATRRLRVRLRTVDELWFGQVRLRMPAEAGRMPMRLALTARAADAQAVVERVLACADPAALAGRIELRAVDLPATALGERDPRWQPDAIQLPGDWGVRLLRGLGVRAPIADPFEPFTYQAVTVFNRGETPVPLLLRARVIDPATGRTVPALSAPALSSGGTGESVQIAECPPGRATRIALPVFVHTGLVEEGVYRREVRGFVLGTDRAVLFDAKPLEIRRTGTLAWVSVGASGVLTLGALLLLALLGERFWRSFRLRELVTIAIYGAVAFAAVTLPGSLLTSVLAAVLGPLSAVVTGLVGRVLGYMVLVSLLVLVPRPGAATLATAVKWSLSAVLFGLVSGTALLYLGTYAVLLEGACWVAGITRPGGVPAGWGRALCAALLVAAADAASTFVDFQITVLLYRVFFADWYVWLTVFLNGFVYTAIGTLLGLRFGRELARVS